MIPVGLERTAVEAAGRRTVRDQEALFATHEVSFAFHRTKSHFELAQTVFASADVDRGSALLLRYLQGDGLDGVSRVIDVGCGHGTLGVVLLQLDPQRTVTAVDRDALAIRYALRNAARNDQPPERHRVFGSLGYDDIDLAADDGVDLVVSNIPGKVGPAAMAELVTGAASRVRPEGLIGFVVVQPLADDLTTAVAGLGGAEVRHERSRAHTVVIARVGEPPARADGSGFERGVYDRSRIEPKVGPWRWKARTAHGIDEFDNLSYATELLRPALQGVRKGRPAVVIGPGQGHRAVMTALSGRPVSAVVSRDLLALRATMRMFADNDLPAPEHAVHDLLPPAELAGRAPLIVLHADDRTHTPWFFEAVRTCLAHLDAVDDDEPRDLVLTGKASLFGRLEADVLRRARGHIAHKESRRGFRVLRFRVPPSA
ncbi:MAG: methyltransferase [Actinomycetota bacterium]